MESINKIKLWIAALIGALTGLWGWIGWLVVGWVVCMALDYITGSLAAVKAGTWSSALARRGIWHKTGMIFVVMVATGADLLIELVLTNMPVIQLPFAYPGLICPIVLVWYIVTEMGSITENAVAMGSPCPPWLAKILAIGKETVDKVGESITGDDAPKGGNKE